MRERDDELLKLSSSGIWYADFKRVSKLVDGGLVAVTMCEFGRARGPEMSRELVKCGVKATFLAEGLRKLKELEADELSKAIKTLQLFPYRYVGLTDNGMSIYGDLVERIGATRWIGDSSDYR